MRSKVLNARLTARAVMLTIWATFFIYLWVSGELVRYIGPRTLWVVPFGAITLSFAALAHMFFVFGAKREPLRRSELLGLVITVLPVTLALIVPAPELGSLAASRKGGTTGLATAIAYSPPEGSNDRPISFIDVHYAGLSDEYAAASGIIEGRDIELTGFVTHDEDQIRLTRFYISCCAADAIPYSVALLTPEGRDFEDDTWLVVSGTLVKSGSGYALEVAELEETTTPKTPYLS